MGLLLVIAAASVCEDSDAGEFTWFTKILLWVEEIGMSMDLPYMQ